MLNLLGLSKHKKQESHAEASVSTSKMTPTVKRYFLAPSLDSVPSSSRSDPARTPPALMSVPEPPRGRPSEVPTSTLLFSLTHPDPSVSPATAFFLECLPDPIGFIYHAACFIRDRIHPLGSTPWSGPVSQGGPSGGMPELPWRHQMIELELEDKPGLAATMGGRIAVSLPWITDIMHQVRNGRRSIAAATHEFKGVLLHEMVHTIQHDGYGSEPGWLIESIADLMRLQAYLGPPHWRVPGQGRDHKGWEEAYDSGARFLAWLTGWEEGSADFPPLEEGPSATTGSYSGYTGGAPPAQPTQYPSGPAPPPPQHGPPPPGSKPRRPPMPNLVRLMDFRLAHERWNDSWWEEMTGARLDVLWAEYLAYYR